ncbi:replicative DNA helicase [Bdellovibrio bacteriovorus]|uniref:Replicative DNA helicase n=1 Tax=Bdellovibrio bacteriovorus TaxID=959 RepID=A0A150WCK8_BDEBC|nr:replicative DNA helicase [Bdellovibrio bacteriovorus]KYG60795.1 replicative DNA helicase [Bdellovibrio bacteriovorus]KYG69006.1 replicative DNA helicase [Bdellovibrio bacteriovorus]
MSTRIPPQNIEAEQSILGGLMLDREALDQVGDILVAEDFYKPSHQKIFNAIKELHSKNQPVDIITVTNILQGEGSMEMAGGPEYLVSLLDKTISSANIVTHAKIVKDKATLRKLIQVNSSLIEKAYEQDFADVESFVDQAESEIFKVGEAKAATGLVGSMEIVRASIKKLEELYKNQVEVTGLATGFKRLDEMTAGLHPGEMTIIAARPSMGKTAFSLNIAQHVALKLKKTVAYFSLEMGKESMMMRMLAAEAKVGLGSLRNGKVSDSEWPRLIHAASLLSEASIFIDDTPGVSPFEIRSKARRLKAEHGLDLIMIDYLQLMSMKQKMSSREQEVAEISKSLKAIAKELKIPVIALAQLNRGVEGRTEKKPMLSDLRESGSIEQDADVIMMLYRDDYYDKENPDKQGHAEVIVGKQRNGATGPVKMRFDAQYNRFRDAEPEERNINPMPPPQAPPPMPGGRPKNFAPGAPV